MALGVGLGLVTVLIWAVWIVGMRQAATVHLPVAWIGLLRYAVPAIVLLPFWWRIGLWPRGVDKRLLALMVGGAGAPFFVMVAFGIRFAHAADVGVLLPGTMPVFVAILSAVFDGERFGRFRIAGFGLVFAAMLVVGGPALISGEGVGRFLIPCAALLWAAYTLAFRRAGIGAFPAAGLIAAWSAIILLPFALIEGPAALLAADPMIIAGQVLSQSILSGIIALVCYGVAVRLLGASRAALLSALVLVFSALLAIPVLGEVPSGATIVAIILAMAGVALGSGAFAFRRKLASAAA